MMSKLKKEHYQNGAYNGGLAADYADLILREFYDCEKMHVVKDHLYFAAAGFVQMSIGYILAENNARILNDVGGYQVMTEDEGMEHFMYKFREIMESTVLHLTFMYDRDSSKIAMMQIDSANENVAKGKDAIEMSREHIFILIPYRNRMTEFWHKNMKELMTISMGDDLSQK